MSSGPERTALEEPRLARLYQISRELSSRLQLDELLPRLLQQAVASVHGQYGSLIVFDEHQRLYHSACLIDGEIRPLQRVDELLAHGLEGWVVRFREPVLIPNTAADPRWYDPGDAWLIQPRAVISVPLLGRERVVGVMTIGQLAAGAFVPEDLSLLAAIAAQAGIAIENARLFSAERREREISNTLREVARTINATLDLGQVLTLVLEQLSHVIEYDSATVMLRHGDRLQISAAHGFTSNAAAMQVSFGLDRGISARVVREARCIVIDDVQRLDEWLPTNLPETVTIRAWIGAPLIARNQVLGLLSLDSRRPGTFTQEDGQLVAAFAEQAASAVLNARLYSQSERRAFGLRALATTAQAINGTRELGEILRQVVKYAQEWLGMEGASLALVDGESLIFKEAVGPSSDYLRGVSIQLGAGIAGWVALNNEPIIVPDVRKDPRFFGGLDQMTGFVTRALACVPVRIQNRVIGVIEVVNPASGVFDPETLDLLDSLASLAGTAIAQTKHMAELQAAENRFVGLFEDNIDPILITDLDGVITDANRRATAFFGYTRDELLGMRVNNLHRVRTDTLSRGRYAPLLTGQAINYQTRLTTKGGDEIPVEVYAKLIERKGQQFIQWVQHDLSERMALEELRNDLMSMIVHDLRSPLGNIVSSLDILRTSLPDGDDMLHSLLSIATRAAGRLSRLVDSLLDLRRLEAGELTLHRAAADLPVLFHEAIEQIQPMADGKGLTVQAVIPAGLPDPELDVDLVRRVLINVLDNAVKYTPPGGSILCRVEGSEGRHSQQLTFSISDTGPGVPEEDQHRIFQKFTRLNREVSKGLGLGLAFCKLAVEAHGGRIWVESVRGRGATFRFTLPVAAVVKQVAPPLAS